MPVGKCSLWSEQCCLGILCLKPGSQWERFGSPCIIGKMGGKRSLTCACLTCYFSFFLQHYAMLPPNCFLPPCQELGHHRSVQQCNTSVATGNDDENAFTSGQDQMTSCLNKLNKRSDRCIGNGWLPTNTRVREHQLLKTSGYKYTWLAHLWGPHFFVLVGTVSFFLVVTPTTPMTLVRQ